MAFDNVTTLVGAVPKKKGKPSSHSIATSLPPSTVYGTSTTKNRYGDRGGLPKLQPLSSGTAESPARRSKRRSRQARQRATALNSLRHSAAQRRRTAAQSLSRLKRTEAAVLAAKPPSFAGRKTAGTPTRAELGAASKSGTLKVNQRGYLTTPAVRKAVKKVGKAQKTLARSTGVQGPLVPEQKRFVKGVAKQTHLSPRAIGAQALAEQSGPAAKFYEEGGEHNYLNIGPGRHYASTPEAVRETAKLINTSSNYAGIRAARGKGPRAQVQAIGDSPWGTSKSLMEQTLGEVSAKRNPKAAKQLQAAKVQAKALGLNLNKTVGKPSKQVVTRFKAAKQAMKEVEGLPYVWGGGHGSPTSSPTGGGLDCSGAVGYVLNKIHAMKGSLTSGAMGSVLKPGPGAITVFYNDEHTFLRAGNEYWGTSVGDSGAGGLGPHSAPSASYLASYHVGHVPGLGRKQALQLGFKDLSGGGSEIFPGMTLSSSGTSATIDAGAGATVSKPGFSSKPIQLTRAQKARRTMRKLKEAGVGVDEAKAPKATSSTLKSLEAKYGVKTG